jgi:hypothetical protein
MLSVTSASPAASKAANAARDLAEADTLLCKAECSADTYRKDIARGSVVIASYPMLIPTSHVHDATVMKQAAPWFDKEKSCAATVDTLHGVALTTAFDAYPPIVGSPATRAVRAEETGKRCGGYSESVIGALYEYFKSIGALDDVSKIADLYNHIRENACTGQICNLDTVFCTKTEPCVGRNHDGCLSAAMIGAIARKFPRRLYDTDKAIETTKKYIFFIWVLLSGSPICEVPCGIRRSIARRQHHEST